MNKRNVSDGEIILDDGVFYVELNVNAEAVAAPGFLQRRCARGLATPGAYECVGSFGKAVDGTWHADVSSPWDEETGSDCNVLARGVDRMDAIAALWVGRHVAHSTHN